MMDMFYFNVMLFCRFCKGTVIMFVTGCDYVKTDDPIVYVFVSCCLPFVLQGWAGAVGNPCQCHVSVTRVISNRVCVCVCVCVCV